MHPHRDVHPTIPALGTVLGVWAHPDDEAYCSAGLMALVRGQGGRVVVATATWGERGTPDPDRYPPARMARLRRLELGEGGGDRLVQRQDARGDAKHERRAPDGVALGAHALLSEVDAVARAEVADEHLAPASHERGVLA